MSSKTKPGCKPNLMALLTFFVGLGMLLTSVAQAAEPSQLAVSGKAGSQQRSWTEQWLRSIWGLDLAGKIRAWKPRVRVDSDGEGVRLSHPFGNRGPALRPVFPDLRQHVRGQGHVGKTCLRQRVGYGVFVASVCGRDATSTATQSCATARCTSWFTTGRATCFCKNAGNARASIPASSSILPASAFCLPNAG